MKHFPLVSIVVAYLTACSGGAGGNFAGGIGGKAAGGKKADKDENSGQTEEPNDAEATPADEPTQISGAFLTMAFMDDQDEVARKVKDEPEGTVDVAAALNSKTKLTQQDVAGLQAVFDVISVDGNLYKMRHGPAAPGSEYHWVLSVPVRHIAGTVMGRFADGSGKIGVRQRNLTTVQNFDARHKFNVESDAIALGLIEGDGGDGIDELGNSAEGAASGGGGSGGSVPIAGTATSGSGGSKSDGGWPSIFAAATKSFGELYASKPEPANTNYGDEAFTRPDKTASAGDPKNWRKVPEKRPYYGPRGGHQHGGRYDGGSYGGGGSRPSGGGPTSAPAGRK